MRCLVILLSFVVALNAQGWNSLNQPLLRDHDSVVTCGYTENVSLDVRNAVLDFTIKIYKRIAAQSNVHFVTSTYSMWQTLAAIAEGTDGPAREELFNILNLPEDECVREKYYQFMATRESPSPDVTLARTRLFLVDESLTVKEYWKEFARTFLLLNTSPSYIKRNPEEVGFLMQQAISSQRSSLNLQGNSVLLDSLDYNGLWNEAFPDARAVRAPFYNHKGEQIGTVDLMRGKKRVRMAYVPQLDTKLLELQVGYDGRYRMCFGIPLSSKDITEAISKVTSSVIFEVLENLRESLVPVEIAIPRFVMTTELDARSILEDIGVSSIWSDPLAAGNISEPAAYPTSFIQRVTVTIDTPGVKYQPPALGVGSGAFDILSEADTGLNPKLGREFIADRPFMFALFDVETYTTLFVAAYSIPTYS